MKTLLIFTDWFAPGFKAGGPIRSVVNLVALLESDYNIFIYTSDRDFNSTLPYSGISLNTWIPYNKRSKVFYASPEHTTISGLRKILKEVRPDTIYLNSMWSVKFTLLPLLFTRFYGIKRIVLAPRGMLKPSALAIKPLKKKGFLWLVKWAFTSNNIIFHATDNDEEKAIGTYFKNKVIIIGNVPGSAGTFVTVTKSPKSLHLVCISRIHPIKNILYVLDLMKHIDTDSKIHLSIYGPKEDELYFQKCKEVSLTIQDNVSIAFHEEVEHEKIQHIIQKHHVFILPTLGENFGHSIFESFASGRPVIISDQTPWRNLENKMVGFDLPLNEKGLWISRISKFVDMDQVTYDNWCKHAHQFGVDFINSTNLKNKYIQLFS